MRLAPGVRGSGFGDGADHRLSFPVRAPARHRLAWPTRLCVACCVLRVARALCCLQVDNQECDDINLTLALDAATSMLAGPDQSMNGDFQNMTVNEDDYGLINHAMDEMYDLDCTLQSKPTFDFNRPSCQSIHSFTSHTHVHGGSGRGSFLGLLTRWLTFSGTNRPARSLATSPRLCAVASAEYRLPEAFRSQIMDAWQKGYSEGGSVTQKCGANPANVLMGASGSNTVRI